MSKQKCGLAKDFEHEEHDCPIVKHLVGSLHREHDRVASGPAQVATPTYRSNYETIFGSAKVGDA